MTPSPPPTDLARIFCDLIMKGGITSGVVYPSAVAKLSERYEFRNIGGASVGAIAAGAAAAAEYGRQRHATTAGFRRLERLADDLGKPPATDPRGPSLLVQLFAPTRLSRPLFHALTRTLNLKSWKGRAARLIGALVRAFPEALVLGVAVLLCISWVATVLAPAFRAALAEREGALAVTVFVLGAALAILAIVAAVAGLVVGFAIRRALHRLALVTAPGSRTSSGSCSRMEASARTCRSTSSTRRCPSGRRSR
jgi:hypothetical protein